MTEYVRLGVTSQLLRTYLHIAAAHGLDYTDLGVHPDWHYPNASQPATVTEKDPQPGPVSDK